MSELYTVILSPLSRLTFTLCVDIVDLEFVTAERNLGLVDTVLFEFQRIWDVDVEGASE